MNQLVESYARMRSNRGLSSSTLSDERYVLDGLARWWDKQRRSPKSMTFEDMETYLYGEGGLVTTVQASSFNTKVVRLRGYVGWLVKRGLMRADVLDAIQRQPVEPVQRMQLSLNQIVYMIESCEDEWERWLLTLASQTLGRSSELCSLKLADFNLDARKLAWHRQKTRDYDELPITRPSSPIHTMFAIIWSRLRPL
jgi:site-specific recombinase XerD